MDHSSRNQELLGQIADNQDWLERVCWALLGKHADPEAVTDLVQDAILNAMKAASKFRGGANLRTWLYTILLNLIRDNYQRGKKGRVSTFSDLEGHRGDDREFSETLIDRDSADPLQCALDRDLLRQALSLLDRSRSKRKDRYMRVLVLRSVFDLPYEQIAALLDIDAKTVKSDLAKARKIIARLR